MNHKAKLTTPYFSIDIDEDGKGFYFRLDKDIKENPHKEALDYYIGKLRESGVERINADQISLPNLDRSLKLPRGGRRLDIVYIKDGELFECELKTYYECGLNRTYEQILEQSKYCKRLILLVPRNRMEFVNSQVSALNVNNIIVDTYEI